MFGVRKAYRELGKSVRGIQQENDQLKVENAKLREMVRDYERCVHATCDRCEYYGNLSTHCPLSQCFPDADELRQLGTKSERTTTADETERIKCRYVSGLHDRFLTVHVMECSACGHTYEHVNGGYEYCPHCGRRIVEVDA